MDPNLAPLNLNAEGIVIRTNRVEVPTAEEVASGDPIDPSKVFGRAIYGLSTEIGRQAFGSNKTPHGRGRDGRGLPRHLDATRSGERHAHRA